MTCSSSVLRWRWLAAAGLACLGMALSPAWVAVSCRSGLRTLLEPGQRIAGAVVQQGKLLVATFESARSSQQRLAELKARVTQLEQEKRALLTETMVQASALSIQPIGHEETVTQAAALLRPRFQEAYVLGQEALHFLAQQRILSIGKRDGAEAGAVLLEGSDGEDQAQSLVLDQGAPQGMQNGQPVLFGRAVVGRIHEAGTHTSVARLVCDVRYRDTVRLVHVEGGALHWGAAGMFTGTGGALCRVTHVNAREAVSVGDLVFRADDQGILDRPLMYGEVVDCSPKPGSTEWDIWVRPAVDAAHLTKVVVMTVEMNAAERAGLARSQ